MLIAITLLCVALLTITTILFFRYKKVKSDFETQTLRFKNVIDIDKEVDVQKNLLSALASEYESKKGDIKSKFTSLEEEYSKSKKLFDELNKELSLVEEKTEIHSFGLYEPHYSFVTSNEYKDRLESIYIQQKDCIKYDQAIICRTEWMVGGSKVEGRKMTKHYAKLMLRAFNGDCDASTSKIKWNNAKNMEERIRKAFEAINKLGTVHNIDITEKYLDLRLKELYLTFELQEKLYEEKEEQRRIREQIREEERVQKEIEQAKKEAEDEEKRYSQALEKARKELEKANGKEVEKLTNKLKDLENKLKEAQELKQRALSRAQITKSGNVYIISNIGSFGENVFKIGMTRRLEPMDRVKELGDASVPFSFDVHAMIYSDDAPTLENKLHKHFTNNRLNLINNRKEFFNVTIDEIKIFAKLNNIDVMFTELAEAREYYESKAKKEQLLSSPAEVIEEKFPNTLIDTTSLGL